MGRPGTATGALTWKLVLGFLFAVVLQVSQMLISSYFTAQMQAAAVQVADAMTASLATQRGIDAARDLRARIAAEVAAKAGKVDLDVHRVYLQEIDDQLLVLKESVGAVVGGQFAAVGAALAAARRELQETQAAQARGGAAGQGLQDALDSLDDSTAELEQALRRAQIDVRALATAGVQREREVHDLPMHASLGITLGGVVLMAVFVAWFSRQLVVPIRRAWGELEDRVAARTAELATTVVELESQIAERQRAESQKEELHRQLVESSRRAGMAELANGVLHNVGNVLNSVNVSASMLLERLRQSKSAGLQRAAELLRTHEQDLAGFLTTSPQGRRLPPYLVQLAGHLVQERDALVGETRDLVSRIDMMKEIVGRQQSYARVAGVTQPTRPSVVVRDVVAMHEASFAALGIVVTTDFAWDEECELDRSRVLQILMNLVANGKQALRDSGRGGAIAIATTHGPGDRLRITVADNGVGIAKDDLSRIFGHGFTTRRDGHGFGLHHSANAAAEMGGRLWAESDGRGQGATFVLELPIRPPARVPAPAPAEPLAVAAAGAGR